MLKIWGLYVKGLQNDQPSNFENDLTPDDKARFWPSILTPFNQRKIIESCATRTSSLFDFKQTFDLPKA